MTCLSYDAAAAEELRTHTYPVDWTSIRTRGAATS